MEKELKDRMTALAEKTEQKEDKKEFLGETRNFINETKEILKGILLDKDADKD